MTPGERLALAKVELDGNLSAVVKAQQEHTHMVYNDEGDIVYKGLTVPDMSLYPECKTYMFKTADVQITEGGKSVAQFMIEEDEHDVCHIKLKTFESDKVKASRDFLSEITSTSKDFDIQFSTTKKEWKITKNKGLKVKQQLVFYVTPLRDPHILIERVVVNAELFANSNTVKVEHKDTLPESYSVYTHKIFENYSIK